MKFFSPGIMTKNSLGIFAFCFMLGCIYFDLFWKNNLTRCIIFDLGRFLFLVLDLLLEWFDENPRGFFFL